MSNHCETRKLKVMPETHLKAEQVLISQGLYTMRN